MKTKIIILFTLLIVAGNITVNAQACNQARDLAERLAEVLETEKSKLRSTKDKAKKMTASQTIRAVKEKWNVIAGNSSASMGARKMFNDNSKVTGVVVGRTQRTFISPPSEHNNLEISLKKVGGKARTEVFICIHSTTGNSEQREEYLFENGKYDRTQKFILNNVQGKMISVIIRGKSVGNTFGYELRSKRKE